MTRLRIVHRTGFSYEHPATASYNEARMLPTSSSRQIVLSSQLEVLPQATQQSYVDYWGAQVRQFEVLHPHTELSVTATSVVEVRPLPEDTTDVTWEQLAEAVATTASLAEQLPQTRVTEPSSKLTRALAKARAAGATPRELALLACGLVNE